MNQRSQVLTQIANDSLEQMCLEGVALRRELGLPGGRLTAEQQRIYLEAKQNQRLSKKTAEKTAEKLSGRITEPQS
ncbi:MAG: hypothetical protein FWC43_05575 [Planctomycetaceae bacterium]|nr:hypothetical protein [Planctomycetaceae bacterium]